MKQVFNPYLPNYEYIPDGEPHVFNGRLYVYGSHDRFGSRFFCDNDYVLWSCPINDLSDWVYHGVIYRKDQDPLNKEGANPLFAPDVTQGKDGRYYLYYAPCNTRSIGVAVSDDPQGPFEFLDHVKHKDGTILGQKEDDPYPFDPAVLCENERCYLYIGFAPDPNWDFLKREFGKMHSSSGPYVMELEDDMCTIKTGCRKIEIADCPDHSHEFFEASSIRKVDDKYCFIYSSTNSHELCHAFGEYPEGPFSYKGIIHDNGDIGLEGRKEKNRVSYTGNNHGSIVSINGKWYVFGHRPSNYSVFARQGVAEEISRNPDGSFIQAEMTSCGLNGKPLENKGRYGAFIACHLTSKYGALHYLDNCESEGFEDIRTKHPAFSQDGEDRENDPSQFIRNMCDGSSAGFKYFVPADHIKLSVFTRGDEGLFEIRDRFNGPLLNTIHLDSNEEFSESETVMIDLPKTNRFSLYFTYKGNGHIDFDSFSLK